MTEVTGSELLKIANDCWKQHRAEYGGLQFRMACNEAMEPKTKQGDKLKVRREAAVHVTSVLFDHTRDQSTDRANRIATQAQTHASASDVMGATDTNDLQDFANEVNSELHQVSEGEFGIIDPSMIISLIQAIIQAVQACRNPAPANP